MEQKQQTETSRAAGDAIAAPTGERLSFDGMHEFQAALQKLLPHARITLQMFDPDFSAWLMNNPALLETLRRFLLRQRQARLQLAMHETRHLEQKCPRFMLLLREFSHAIECRITPKHLRQLTDSFCMADGVHIVRRFHSDHFRGEMRFDTPGDCAIPAERFTQIWDESEAGLRASVLGL